MIVWCLGDCCWLLSVCGFYVFATVVVDAFVIAVCWELTVSQCWW